VADVLADDRCAEQLGAFTRFQVSCAVRVHAQLTRWPHRQAQARTDVARDLPALTRWASEAYFGAPSPATRPERLGIVLLSYRRAENIAPLVHSYLRCGWVGTVVVCNNNPEVDLAPQLGEGLPNVRLIQRPRRTRQGIRLALAAELAAEHPYLATIDDDIFFTPDQLRALFDALVDDPECVHGFQGERLPRPGERPTWMFKNYDYVLGYQGDDSEVEHLTNAYFFTREQATRAVSLAKEHGMGELEDLGNGEDILLSASGRRKPRIHRVGPVLSCFSSTLADVATCATASFFDERRRVVDLLAPAFAAPQSAPAP